VLAARVREVLDSDTPQGGERAADRASSAPA
jgi:hypothetical protein